MRATLPDLPLRAISKDLAGFTVDTATAADVATRHGITDGRTLLVEARHHDDGDKRLTEPELVRAALSLSSPTHAQLGRGFRGTFQGRRFEAKQLDAVVRHFGVADVRAVLERAVIGLAPGRAIDLDHLRAAAAAIAAERSRDVRFSDAELERVIGAHALPGRNAVLGAARWIDDGDHVLTPAELARAAKMISGIVKPNDVAEVHRRIEALRGRADVAVTELGRTGPYPIHALHFASSSPAPKLRLLVTGGVHGNEPIGTGAAMLLVEQWLANPALREQIELTVVPLVNPRGMARGTRRTPEHVDLNRRFDRRGEHPEVDAIHRLFAERTFDMVADLHSGGAVRDGFWVLHQASKDVLRPALADFGEHWPRLWRHTSPYTIAEPGLGESDNAATLKGLAHAKGARWAMTVEAPASVSYEDGVAGEIDLLRSAIASALRGR